MGRLSFLSINVNGCRGVEKRFKLIEYLKAIPSDIIFLQETHSLEQDETFWKRAWRGKLLFSHFLSNSCGVAILIRPNMSFDLENMCYRIFAKMLLLWQEILIVHSTPSMIEQARLRATSILLIYYVI